MFLTKEILNKCEACPEGIAWFNRHFENGAELMEVMKQRHIPIEFLDWGFLHLSTSQEEKKRYFELAEIVNSEHIFNSHKVVNSSIISDSNNVTDSKYIYFCEDITNCQDMSHVHRAQSSKRVTNASAIFVSNDIVQSTNIKNSYNISQSNYIIDSHDLYKATLCTSACFSLFVNNVQDSAFCNRVKDSNHCLFCADIDKGEYLLFNKPLVQSQWEFIYDELRDIFAVSKLKLFTPWEKEDANHEVELINNYHVIFDQVFENKRLVHWVKHLPNYDDMLAYKITYNSEFLK